MNPIILSALVIPGAIAFGLITLLIKERFNLLPKKTNTGHKTKIGNQTNVTLREDHRGQLRKKYPEDFLDLSGGTMGI